MNIEQIKTAIAEIRFYNVETLRALAQLASEIKAVRDAEIRHELTREFEAQHGRKVAVWARIPKRFADWMETVTTVDGFLALAYACQLPDDASRDLIAEYSAHLDEPLVHLLVLGDVNEQKPKRERAKSLAKRIASHVLNTDANIAITAIALEREVARELKRMENEDETE